MWCTTWSATYSALDATDKLLQLFIHLGNFAFCVNVHRRQSLNFIDAKKPGSGAGNYRQIVNAILCLTKARTHSSSRCQILSQGSKRPMPPVEVEIIVHWQFATSQSPLRP
jgi:hypothetical protein